MRGVEPLGGESWALVCRGHPPHPHAGLADARFVIPCQ